MVIPDRVMDSKMAPKAPGRARFVRIADGADQDAPEVRRRADREGDDDERRGGPPTRRSPTRRLA